MRKSRRNIKMVLKGCGGNLCVDAATLSHLIASIGIEGARWVEENVDEQFTALQYLYRHMGDPSIFPRLVVANALVSYQLSGTGEEWWWEFARWFSGRNVENIYRAYGEFLPKSKTNRRLVNAKLKRLERLREFLAEIDVYRYYKDMLSLRDDLARVLGSRKDAKTVVFAVKMFGYAMRIVTGVFRPYPMEIPIPLDSRIRRVTERLTDEDPISFWHRVAKNSGVPPLHIDSILWTAYKESARKILTERFGTVGHELVRLIW